MRFRRRFEVVVEGESGSAISQRSVISEHRTEREAREAAGLERRRLEVIRAEEAASWVITVVRGDEVLHEERPFEGRREAAPVSPLGIPRGEPAAPPAGGEATGPGDVTEPGGAPDEAPADAPGAGGDDAGSTGTIPVVAAPAGEPHDAADGAPGDHAADGEDARAGAGPAAPAGEGPEAAPAAADAPRDEAAADDAGEVGGEAAGERRPIAPFVEELFGPEDTPMPDFLRAGRPPGRAEAPPAAEEPAPAGESAGGANGAPADAGDAGETGRARRPSARDVEPPPSGPVPEDVIRRFEASIERERERTRDRGPRGGRD